MNRATAALLATAACTPAAASTSIIVHAGSWETQTRIANMPERSVPSRLVCWPADRALDVAAIVAMKSHPNTTCGQPAFSQAGTTATYALNCTVGDLHIHMSGTITMRGPDAFTNHMISHAEMAGRQPRDMDMTSVTRRVGPCQPGETHSQE